MTGEGELLVSNDCSSWFFKRVNDAFIISCTRVRYTKGLCSIGDGALWSVSPSQERKKRKEKTISFQFSHVDKARGSIFGHFARVSSKQQRKDEAVFGAEEINDLTNFFQRKMKTRGRALERVKSWNSLSRKKERKKERVSVRIIPLEEKDQFRR